MPLNEAAHDIMLDALGGQAGWISAHTADPGAGGANEVTGGSYQRVAVTWNPAASENLDSSNTPQLSIPAGNTITHLGQWSASSGGTFLGSWVVNPNEVFSSDGLLTASDLDWNLAPV